MLFFALTVAYALRVNLSVAIVAMVDRKAANKDYEEFDWDEETKSVILSSFFWGYVVTQIPAGQLAQRYGPKILLLFSIGVCSLLAVLTPFCAHAGGAKVWRFFWLSFGSLFNASFFSPPVLYRQ